MKNPPKCVGGNLRIISCQYFNQSTVSAPVQYISQFYTAVYYLPGLLQNKYYFFHGVWSSFRYEILRNCKKRANRGKRESVS
jgi:hypothetical protein